MGIKFNVKYKIKINGKEYSSPEEMPDNIREAYEKATANSHGIEGGKIPLATSGKITFNGQEYENVDAMPADIRQMYETIMKSVKEGTLSSTVNANINIGASASLKNAGVIDSSSMSKPIAPQLFFSPRVIVIVAAALALLVGLYFVLMTK